MGPVALFSFRVFMSQKIILLLAAALILLLLIFAVGVRIETHDGLVTSLRIFGSAQIAGEELRAMLEIFIATYSAIMFSGILILSIIATAGLVPDLFTSGVIAFLLTRDLSRSRVLLGMFVGIVAGFGLLDFLLMFGFWFILYVKLGYATIAVMTMGLPLFFAFGSVFSVMLLLSVVFRNTGVVTLFGFAHSAVLSGLLASYQSIPSTDARRIIRSLAGTLYYILPQVSDLQQMSKAILVNESYVSTPILFSVVSSFAMLSISAAYFRRRDI